jgi:hypothetical protein
MPTASSSRIARSLMIVALVSGARLAAAEGEITDAPTAPAPDPVVEEPTLSDLPRTMETAEREPRGAFPPAPPAEDARTVSASLSIGPGWLALRDDLGRDGQGSTSLAARLGVVVAPEWCLFLGIDRSSTKRGAATFAQTAALLGLQRYFLGRLYVGGAGALAMVRESGVPGGLTDGPGYGFSALVGIEAVKTRHAALTAELSFTLATYGKESWEMGGLRVGLVVF